MSELSITFSNREEQETQPAKNEALELFRPKFSFWSLNFANESTQAAFYRVVCKKQAYLLALAQTMFGICAFAQLIVSSNYFWDEQEMTEEN